MTGSTFSSHIGFVYVYILLAVSSMAYPSVVFGSYCWACPRRVVRSYGAMVLHV